MVHCQNCQAGNTLDSKFCRSCGTAMADDVLQAALIEHAKLVAEGERMVLDRRWDEALAVAETAIAEHPGSREALCLKASVHEHRGELGDAITAYERVVELYPDSSIDKIKLNHLRNVLTLQEPTESTAPQRRRALLSGLAATVLVVCVGALIGLMQGRNQSDNPKLALDDTQIPSPVTGAGQQQTFQNPGANPTGQAQSQVQPGANPNANPSTDGGFNSGIPRGTVIQGPLTDRVPGLGGVDPVIPPMRPVFNGDRPIEVESRPVERVEGSGNSSRTGSDPPPTTTQGGSPAETSVAVKPADDPGFISIKVSEPGGPRIGSGGASGSTSSGSGAKALLVAAQSLHQTGDYAKAAATYERALEAGADPGRTNQNLAMVYQQLGRRNDAVRAYQRAIQGYERQIASGGDSSRLKVAIETCKKAVDVLGG